MPKSTTRRERLFSRATGVAAFLAATLPAALSLAQPPLDFRAHVTGRVPLAMPEVNGCGAQLAPGFTVPPTLDVDAQVGARGLSVRALNRAMPTEWRVCVEQAIARAIAVAPGTPRTESVRMTVTLGQGSGAPVPPMQPAPLYTVGQVVQVQWNDQWYNARVLVVEPNGMFRIRYEGWSDSWDEAVPPERIRQSGEVPRRPPPPRPRPMPQPGPMPMPQPGPMPMPPVNPGTVDLQRELDEGGRFRIRDVNLGGQGPVLRLPRGGVVSGTATIDHNCTFCGGAINQVIVSLATDSRAQQCVWNGGPSSGGPRQVSFSLSVPSQPGVYEVRARYAQAYGCDQGALDWWRVDRPNGPVGSSTIAVVLVGGVEPQIRVVGGSGPIVPPMQPTNNLVVNGGFEQPALGNGTWQVLPQIQGWFTSSGSGFEIQAGVAGAPFEGRQLIELDGDGPTTIGQELATRPGTAYEISFAFSARPGTPRNDNRVLVLWDGQPIGRLEADGSARSETTWTVGTFRVTARSGRSRLELRDEGTPNSLGTYIDDVRVTPVR